MHQLLERCLGNEMLFRIDILTGVIDSPHQGIYITEIHFSQ